jgi:hypothetical protein
MSQSDRFGSGFVLGALVGGVLGGVLGASLVQRAGTKLRKGQLNGQGRRPHLREPRLRETDGSVEGRLEEARQSMEDKISLINQAIENLRQEMDTVEEQQTGSSPLAEE